MASIRRPQGSGDWREYVSGAGSGALAITLTFPINKTMFRQQIHNISPKEAIAQLRKEGSFHLYRGIMSPLMMKVLSHSVMFGSYTQYLHILKGSKSSQTTRYLIKVLLKI